MKGTTPAGDDPNHALILQLVFVLRRRLDDIQRVAGGEQIAPPEALQSPVDVSFESPVGAQQPKSSPWWTQAMDDATSTFPNIEFFFGLAAVLGIFLGIYFTEKAWLPVVALVTVLGLVVFGTHWRAQYLREIKGKQRDLTTMRVALAASIVFAIAIVSFLAMNSKPVRVEIGRINPFPRGFLGSPLACGDPRCDFTYSQNVYTSSIMLSVLDHSLKRNANGLWQYGTLGNGGGNGAIIAFNGEIANGTPNNFDPKCVGGIIHLQPAPGLTDMVINPGPCGTGFASYDENPGYDFRAEMHTPVRAAAGGVVVNNGGTRCILTNIPSCAAVNFVGIDHGNGYFSQYGYLSSISVKAGQTVLQGQQIGLSGSTGTSSPRLHFEVIKLIPGQPNNYAAANYAVVDPYGWVGGGTDPLYSVGLGIPSEKLWQ